MELSKIVYHMNNEVKNIILGFLVKGAPKTALKMHEELSDLLQNAEGWIPSASTLYDYLHSFYSHGIVDSNDNAGTKNRFRVSEERYYLKDKRYADAALFLLRLAVKEGRSLFSIFGHRKHEDASTSSSLENRLAIMKSLSKGEPKTLTKIIREVGAHRDVVFSNVNVLADVGFVDAPDYSVFDSNHYVVKEDLRNYFMSKLPSAVQQVLEQTGKKFTLVDICNAAGLGKKAGKHLRRMERVGILESTGGEGRRKEYHIAVTCAEKKSFNEFLEGTDRILFKMYSKGMLKGGFATRDIYPNFRNISRISVRNLLKRLESSGYIHKTIDCKDKRYSLSAGGREFWEEGMLPIEDFFRGRKVSSVNEFGSSYFNNLNGVGQALFVEKALHLYEVVCPYLKQEELSSKAEKVMYVLLSSGRISRQELMDNIDIHMNEAITYLRQNGYMRSIKEGPYSHYTPTKTGIKKYSYLLRG